MKDTALLEEYGRILMEIKLFPYFEVAHFLLACLAVREDIKLNQPGKSQLT